MWRIYIIGLNRIISTAIYGKYTNIWEEKSGEITAIAYVIESNTNLAIYKNTVDIGKISADSTAEIEIPVVLSNNSYKVDILIFEDGKLVLKGKLTINAYPVYIWDELNRNYQQQWNTRLGFDRRACLWYRLLRDRKKWRSRNAAEGSHWTG